MTKDNSLLLVIDPINSCAHEKCETPEWNIYFSKIRLMLPKLASFIEEYKKKTNGLVIYTTVTPWNKEHLTKNINELYTDPQAYYYSDDTTGFDEQFHTVKPLPEDLVFDKNTYDVFTNDKLLQELRSRDIRYIIVTGIFSDGCVLSSVASGFSKGFNFVILKDLIETTDDEKRQRIQELLISFTFPKMYGKTMTSTQLLESL
ncbi:MAG: isochorismatase family cysteine hydrolase [Candidatus Paceibacterota bacterium]